MLIDKRPSWPRFQKERCSSFHAVRSSDFFFFYFFLSTSLKRVPRTVVKKMTSWLEKGVALGQEKKKKKKKIKAHDINTELKYNTIDYKIKNSVETIAATLKTPL